MTEYDICVRVPATSANLGPGFDVMGLALSLYNEIYFKRNDGTSEIKIECYGAGREDISLDFEDNLIGKMMKQAAEKSGKSLPGGTLTLVNSIPVSRGLGSSAAAIVGGLVLANELLGAPLAEQDILDLATAEEGHPDNVVPAYLGGLCVSGRCGERVWHQKVEVPESLSFVTVSPDCKLSTHEARKVLPAAILHQEAVQNVSRAVLLLLSVMRGQYEWIQEAFQDNLHVPYRIGLIPKGQETIDAALQAGALGATISGSGSTMIAVTNGKEEAVLQAMKAAMEESGYAVEGHILHVPASGVLLDKP